MQPSAIVCVLSTFIYSLPGQKWAGFSPDFRVHSVVLLNKKLYWEKKSENKQVPYYFGLELMVLL